MRQLHEQYFLCWFGFVLFFFFFCWVAVQDRDLCNSGCPRFYYIDQVGLRDMPACASRMLGLKLRAIMPGPKTCFKVLQVLFT